MFSINNSKMAATLSSLHSFDVKKEGKSGESVDSRRNRSSVTTESQRRGRRSSGREPNADYGSLSDDGCDGDDGGLTGDDVRCADTYPERMRSQCGDSSTMTSSRNGSSVGHFRPGSGSDASSDMSDACDEYEELTEEQIR